MMEHMKSGKRTEDENAISERRETVTVQTAARGGVPSSPNRPASGSGGKVEIKFLQHENEDEKNDDEEEELEDVQDTLKASCGASPKCSELLEVLNECNDRVNSREKTLETCEQEIFDFVGCVNACVVKELFNHLK